MSTPRDEVHEQLRAWARGMFTAEAATELLIRGFDGRFVQSGWPWIHPTRSGWWIDFGTIPVQIGALSGGERRFLLIAASIGDPDTTINLGDCLAGLNRSLLRLALAATAHAAGSHQHTNITIDNGGRVIVAHTGPLYPWTTPAAQVNAPAAAPARRSL